MEGICGVIRPDLVPDWISKIGPGLAALIAVLLYGLNRWHVYRDLVAKRRVLNAMLKASFNEAAKAASGLAPFFGGRWTDEHGHPDAWSRSRASMFRIGAIARLTELQNQLVSVASHGDEATASFIEACRTYDQAVSSFDAWLAQDCPDPGPWQNARKFSIYCHLDGVRTALEAVNDAISRARTALYT